jgi:pyruvate dehydrogenase (quinone)
MTEKVAKVIIDTLQAAGVRHCYGIVGDTLNVIAGYIDRSEIKWVHMRHEEAGAFAAQAEAQLTGRLTAMAGTCGPGSLHFINGLYEAYRNRAPTILIATQVVTAELGHRFIQEVDFKSLYRDCSVFCDMIYTPEQALRKTVLACQTAIARKGPAVLIVPVDIALSEMHDQTPYRVQVTQPTIRPSDAELEHMALLLNKGGDVVIYGGSGCAEAHDQVVALAERIKAPVVFTSRAKGFLEHDNPHSIGMTGLLGNEAAYHAVLECDTLLMLGADFAWKQFYPDKATIIQVDVETTHLGQRHPVSLGVTGDIKATIEALLPHLQARGKSSFYDRCLSRAHKVLQAHADKAAQPGPHGKIPGKYLATLIDKHADKDAVISVDDGTPTVWMLRHIAANGQRRFLASLLHGTMAGGLPSAIGAQKAFPGNQVLALCGDGGLAMLFGDIMTLAQEKLPIKVIVFDNGKLGFVEIEQKTEGMLSLYTDLVNPDFGAVAKAMGFYGDTVDQAGVLESRLIEFLAHPGPALLHVKVEAMELVMPPNTELKPAMGMALYAARAVLHGHAGDVLEMIEENR